MEFIGFVAKRKLTDDVRSRIAKFIEGFPDGKKLRITITEARKKRSLDQNAYWFGILDKHVVPVFREYGDNWSSWKVHEYAMNELGYQEVLVDPKGKLFVSRKHSSGFTTVEWEEFMERARELFARVHGIAIPLPNEGLNGE